MELGKTDISRLCRQVNGRSNYAFGGDCGMFALGMCRFLSEHGISGMKLVFSIDGDYFEDGEDISAYDLATSEIDIYHVSFKVGNDLYDGDGVGNENLKPIASDEYSDSNPRILEYDWNDPNVKRAVLINTNYTNNDTAFYNEAVKKYDKMLNSKKKRT